MSWGHHLPFSAPQIQQKSEKLTALEGLFAVWIEIVRCQVALGCFVFSVLIVPAGQYCD